MKEIIIGDIHVDAPSKFEHPKGNYILDCCIQSLGHIISYGEEHGIKKYTFLGDIFEKKDKIPNRSKNKVIDIFKRLSRCDVIILEGNHDREGSDSSIKFLEPYAKIISKPTAVKGRLYIPYTKDYDEIIRIVQLSNDYDIIFGHFEIKGCNYGGIVNSNNGISIDAFNNKTAIAGHIHRFQEVSNSIYHLGSIYQVDWGEQSEKKYFCIIDNEDIIFKKLPTLVNRVTLEYGDKLAGGKIIIGSFNMAKIVYESRSINAKDVIAYKEELIKMGFNNVSIEPFCAQMSGTEWCESKNLDSIYSKFVKDSLEEVKNVSQRVLYRGIINEVMEEK